MKDPRDPLSNTLQTWRHEPAPDADFNDRVRARILAQPRPARANGRVFRFRFPATLPLAACLAVLLAAAAGTTTAFALNNARASERMAENYARSIDPVLMTDARAGAHNHSAP